MKPDTCNFQGREPITVNHGLSVQPPVSPARWPIVLAGAVIVLVALAAYQNSFSGPFIFDDAGSITANPTIHRFGTAFSPPLNQGVGGRPILNLTFALNYALSGLNVWSYHAFNLLVHALAGLTLFGIVKRTLRERPTSSSAKASTFAKALADKSEDRSNIQRPTSKSNNPSIQKSGFGQDATLLALAVAVLWVVHPLQTEAVTYVSQRAESLMGLLYLLTLYWFIRGADGGSEERGNRYQVTSSRSRESGARSQVIGHQRSGSESLPNSALQSFSASAFWLTASILACLLGVLIKEVIVTAPVMVLLYDRTFVAGSFREAWRQRRLYYLGLAGAWVLLACFLPTLHRRAVGFGQGVTGWEYALTSCRSIVSYVKLAVWPHPLVLDYGDAIVRHLADIWPDAGILAVGLAGTAIALWRWPAVGFLGAWFFLILAPTSSFVPVAGQPMAEHRVYLSLVAAVALIVGLLYRWWGRRSFVWYAMLAVGLGLLTVRRNEDYRSDLAIWSDAVAKCPYNPRAHNNLGFALASIPGRLPDAISAYQAALQLDPIYADAHYNLGTAWSEEPGRSSQAIAEFESAIQIKPDYAEAHYNLANELHKIPGRTAEVIAEYKAALRSRPDYAEAHYNLANVLFGIPGRVSEAIAEYEAVIRIKPDYAEAHYDLANALFRTPGRLSEAIAEYETALQVRPNYAEAHNNLGLALLLLPNHLTEAIAQFQAALKNNPHLAEAHLSLGKALLKEPGQLPEAMAQFKAALQTNPGLAEAHLNLGFALSHVPGRLPDAISEYREALRLDPNDANAHYNLARALSNLPDKLPETVAEYEAALRCNPDFSLAHNDLGCSLGGMPGRLPEAIKHFQAAVRIDPDYADAHVNLGLALSETPGQLSAAMAEFEAALRIDPNLESARQKLAELRTAQK